MTEEEILAAWHEKQIAAGGEYAARWSGVSAAEMLAGAIPGTEKHFEQIQYEAGAITREQIERPDIWTPLVVAPAPAVSTLPVVAISETPTIYAASFGALGIEASFIPLLVKVLSDLISEEGPDTAIIDVLPVLTKLLGYLPGWGKVAAILLGTGLTIYKVYQMLNPSGEGVDMADGSTAITVSGGMAAIDGVVLQGPGVKEPYPGMIAKSWTIRFDSKQGDFKVQYWRLIDGRVLSHNQRTGIYHIWRPKKHLVLTSSPRIGQLVKAARLINRLTVKSDKKLKRVNKRLKV